MIHSGSIIAPLWSNFGTSPHIDLAFLRMSELEKILRDPQSLVKQRKNADKRLFKLSIIYPNEMMSQMTEEIFIYGFSKFKPWQPYLQSATH